MIKKKRTIYLVGASSFIARHFYRLALDKGFEVRGFASTAKTIQLNQAIQVSLLPSSELAAAKPESDSVIVYAAHIGPSGGKVVDNLWHDDNMKLFSTVIKFSNKNNLSKLIFLSSGGTIYGEPESLPVNEDVQGNPISAYGKLKLEMENLLNSEIQNKESAIILRISNAYGPGQDSTRGQGLIDALIRATRLNSEIILFGDGTEARDYVHVSCVADAILKSIENTDFHGTLNIGSGTPQSNSQMVALVEELSGKKINIKWHPRRRGDIHSFYLDTTRANETLGWKPTILLNSGVYDLLNKKKGFS